MSQKSEYDFMKEIEELLSGVLIDLSNLTEDNFAEKFNSAKRKMQNAGSLKDEFSSKFQGFKSTKKIIELSKLVSEKFDNIVQEWQKKVKSVQTELEQIQNQKKILIYNR